MSYNKNFKNLTKALQKIPKNIVPSGRISERDAQEPPEVEDLIDWVLEERTKHRNFFRPSMLPGCDRANYFHYTHAPYHPQRHPPRLMRILDNGTAIHEVIQGYFSDLTDWWFAKETRCLVNVSGALVRGSCDGVLIRRHDRYAIAIEIKTMGHDQFMRLTAPLSHHVEQSTIYMRLQHLQWVVIIYWDKDKQNIKTFSVKYSPKYWEKIVARVVGLKGHVDRKELPAYDASTCDVGFCPYVDYCRKRGAPI